MSVCGSRIHAVVPPVSPARGRLHTQHNDSSSHLIQAVSLHFPPPPGPRSSPERVLRGRMGRRRRPAEVPSSPCSSITTDVRGRSRAPTRPWSRPIDEASHRDSDPICEAIRDGRECGPRACAGPGGSSPGRGPPSPRGHRCRLPGPEPWRLVPPSTLRTRRSPPHIECSRTSGPCSRAHGDLSRTKRMPDAGGEGLAPCAQESGESREGNDATKGQIALDKYAFLIG